MKRIFSLLLILCLLLSTRALTACNPLGGLLGNPGGITGAAAAKILLARSRLKESDLTRLHAFDNAAYRKAALKPEDEIFPFCYFQYGLEKAGVEMGRLLKLADYAAKIGRDPANVRQKILLGGLPSAVKMGRDWFIPADAPYEDNRITSGKYIDVKRNR